MKIILYDSMKLNSQRNENEKSSSMNKKIIQIMYLTKVKMGIKHIVFKVQNLTCCDKHV